MRSVRVPRAWWVGGSCGALVAVLAYALVGGDSSSRRATHPRTAVPGVGAPSTTLTTGPPPAAVQAPPQTTDGCHGMVTAAQVSRAAGIPVGPVGGDAAAAVAQYGESLQRIGLQANVRLCPFGSGAGDQVTVVVLSFPDAGQAARMFESGRGTGSLQPVTGIGDAALTDGSKTLLVHRGQMVIAVHLVAAANPDADHLGALKALAGLVR